MSADEEIVSEPLTSALKENNSVEEPSEKTKKTMLRGYRQKLQSFQKTSQEWDIPQTIQITTSVPKNEFL